ncbi:MAG TPA: hypothetical protein VID73_12665 [Ktedonobacterales bacterium]|jgi:hypothetical protein
MTQPAAAASAPVVAAPVPHQVTCPICATTFEPHATLGRCPVCGEQVIPAATAARNIPLLSPAARRILGRGNWRVLALIALIVYQIVLFIALWLHLASIHAL